MATAMDMDMDLDRDKAAVLADLVHRRADRAVTLVVALLLRRVVRLD